MTRLDRALEELFAACGSRPCVVVVETAHAEADRSVVQFATNQQPAFVCLGLFDHARLKIARDLTADMEPTPEEPCG